MAQRFIEAAQQAHAEGKTQRARRLMINAVREYPDDPHVWWVLADLVDDPAQKLDSWRQVLRLDPNNQHAKDEISRLESTVVSTSAASATAPVVRNVIESNDGVLLIEEDVDTNQDNSSDKEIAVLVASVLVALGAIILTVVLVLTGTASDVLGIRALDEVPTSQPLVFGIPACSTSADEQTVMVFINNSDESIQLTSASEAGETQPTTIEPGEQLAVEVVSAVDINYRAQTVNSPSRTGTAVIEVPSGNTCHVPIE